jgi:hypothetical protein
VGSTVPYTLRASRLLSASHNSCHARVTRAHACAHAVPTPHERENVLVRTCMHAAGPRSGISHLYVEDGERVVELISKRNPSLSDDRRSHLCGACGSFPSPGEHQAGSAIGDGSGMLETTVKARRLAIAPLVRGRV